MNNIIEFLQKSTEKINSAISDIDYASSYSRSGASYSYCGYAKSNLREALESLKLATAKLDNPSELLQKSIDKISNAISNADYASSYSRSSATTSYCGYAKSSLRTVKEDLKSILSSFDKDKSESNEENLEQSL